MDNLVVIFDPVLEIAAIVHTDNHVGWGPAMIGPDAPKQLQAFIDQTPFDIGELDTWSAASAFKQFLERNVPAAPPETGTVDQLPPEPVPDTTVAPDALAVAEATQTAASPPAPAPADTDVVTAPPAPQQIIQCPNCNGEGAIKHGDMETAVTCGMCQGSGQVTITT
jgi:hypothetical protein